MDVLSYYMHKHGSSICLLRKRGRMLAILIALALTFIQPAEEEFVPTVEEYVSPHGYLWEPIHVTWYVNPSHNKTANGGNTFIGSCAASPDHIGDVAALYSIEGYFIGYLDCNDTGGAKGIKNGTVLDVYADSEEEIHRAASEWGTEFYVVWIKAQG